MDDMNPLDPEGPYAFIVALGIAWLLVNVIIGARLWIQDRRYVRRMRKQGWLV